MFYSLRITLGKVFNLADDTEITTEHRARIKYLIAALVREKVTPGTNFVLAKEKKNKYGEATHFHYHFNFESEVEKESLRKWITRQAIKNDYRLRGRACYCFQQMPNVTDYHRWFRYCLKENYSTTYTRFAEEEGAAVPMSLSDLILLARDERARSIAHNLETRERLQNKATYFDKIVKKLGSLEPKLTTEKQIYIYITTYYCEDRKPVNPTTIKGYTYNYMLSQKLLSYEEFYNLTF